MNSDTLAAGGPADGAPRAGWNSWMAGAGMLIGLAIFAVLFWDEGEAALRVWIDSAAYSHCFFVLPIAAWLAWDRRHVLDGLVLRPLPAAALLALPIGLVWFAANRLGIMEGRQLAVIAAVEVLFLTVLGWRFCMAMMAPLLYLIFLVPFGAFAVPTLQKVTTWFVEAGLSLLVIPHYIDAFIIEVSSGVFQIAEACAGLRFLIASIAFGALYACLIYRSPKKRALFILASIVIPIIANGFRALGIVVLGEILGSPQAAAVDHVLYGWIFFSIVILLLIVAGLPFREDSLPPPRLTRLAPLRPAGMNPLAALPAPLLLTALAPLLALSLDRSATLPPSPPTAGAPAAGAPAGLFTEAPGCVPATTDGPQLQLRGRDIAAQRFSCQGMPLIAVVQPFSPRTTASALYLMQRAVSGEDIAEESDGFSVKSSAGAAQWRGLLTMGPDRISASALWIDGAPSVSGMQTRLAQARNSVLGGEHAPVLVMVMVPLEVKAERKRAQAALESFLNAQTGLAEKIVQISRSAAKG